MPKKTKKISKQAQGWITRRARAAAVSNASNIVTETSTDLRKNLAPMLKTFKNAPLPAAVLLDGPLMPIGKKSSDDFAAEITLAARKKGGAQVVERLLEQRISTVVSDTRDAAWRMHHRLTMDSDVRRRNRVIEDFMAMATRYGGQITMVGSTTVQAIVEALQEAGYSERGRHMPAETNAETDTKAVR